MSEAQNFLDNATAGNVPLAEIDDFVEKWHRGESAQELHGYLGMTRAEYALWLDNPDMLAVICAARRRRQPLAEAIGESLSDLRATTARSGDSAKIERLQAWLRQQGVNA